MDLLRHPGNAHTQAAASSRLFVLVFVFFRVRTVECTVVQGLSVELLALQDTYGSKLALKNKHPLTHALKYSAALLTPLSPCVVYSERCKNDSNVQT